jgi:hypothetical protein
VLIARSTNARFFCPHRPRRWLAVFKVSELYVLMIVLVLLLLKMSPVLSDEYSCCHASWFRCVSFSAAAASVTHLGRRYCCHVYVCYPCISVLPIVVSQLGCLFSAVCNCFFDEDFELDYGRHELLNRQHPPRAWRGGRRRDVSVYRCRASKLTTPRGSSREAAHAVHPPPPPHDVETATTTTIIGLELDGLQHTVSLGRHVVDFASLP